LFYLTPPAINLNGNTYPSVYSDYLNRFHFLSLPLLINYQTGSKTPLCLSAGISMQKLIYTNGLNYSYPGPIYYQDNKAFRKFQLFVETGIDYKIIDHKKFSISAGPTFIYGLTPVSKVNRPYDHLFSATMTTRLLFKK